jgi:hypothetical protein
MEILAAGTADFIDANVGECPGAAPYSCEVCHTARDHVFAFAFLAALKTGVILGLNQLVLNIIVMDAD